MTLQETDNILFLVHEELISDDVADVFIYLRDAFNDLYFERNFTFI